MRNNQQASSWNNRNQDEFGYGNDRQQTNVWNEEGSFGHNSGNGFDSAFALLNNSLNQMKNFSQGNTFRQVPEPLHCGEVRPKDEGMRVKICGKIYKRPNAARFLEIKDYRGCTQLVARDDHPEILDKFQSLPNETFIAVIGTVQLRPKRYINRVS